MFKLVIVCLAVIAVTVSWAEYTPPVKAGVFLGDINCRLDPRINITTIAGYNNATYIKQIFEYLWDAACGRSRGVFTISDDAYKGNTYSCANWPTQWGITQINDWFKSPDVYKDHLHYLDLYLQGNYNTTAVHGPSTCDFVGFTKLYCGEEREQPWKNTPWYSRIGNMPFRGVNCGGLFVLEPWITPNFTQWTLNLPDQYTYSQLNPQGSAGYQLLVNHWNNWYTNADFAAMKAAGLNAVRLPVGWWYFAPAAMIAYSPYTIPEQDVTNLTHPITKVIKYAYDNGIVVILDLHGAPASQNGLDNSGKRSKDPIPERWGFEWFYDPVAQENTTLVLVAMAKYIDFLAQNGIDNVVALELLNEPWVFGDMSVVRDFYVTSINAIREVSQVPIIVHDAFRHEEWDWLLENFPYKNVFMDTHIYHAFNADDIASSTSNCDHNKMIVAENIACGYGSLLRFKSCLGLPTLLGEWSLAIDDCIGIIRGAGSSVQTRDYGQCLHLKERLGDPWWVLQYQKFALKQMAMAERELGWFFWTWKTGPGAENDVSVDYWDFSRAIQAKIIPTPLQNYNYNITTACYQFEDTEPYTC
jgi:glucan 1,3-beta-glucosidase